MITNFNSEFIYSEPVFTSLAKVIEEEKGKGTFLYMTEDEVPCDRGCGMTTIRRAFFLKTEK